jgi:hypothetical protein
VRNCLVVLGHVERDESSHGVVVVERMQGTTTDA